MALAKPRGGISELKTLKQKHSADVEKHEIILSGGNVLVAVSAAPANEEAVFIHRGPVSFPKGAEAISASTTVYWDADPGVMTTTSTDNTPAGMTKEAAESSDSEVFVYLKEN